MKLFHLLPILANLFSAKHQKPPLADTNSVVQYYKNLILEEQHKSQNYVMPTDNGRFCNVQSQGVIDYGEFDFVIVGAGSAGSVIANRLTENKNWKVLLLEAGGMDNKFTDIPAMIQYSIFSKNNWGYYTEPQKHACQGMVDHKCNYPRGHVLGGSSTINALMYVRGNKEDYNSWKKLGIEGWCYEKVLPYFKKSEHSQLPDCDSKYHGTDGLLNVAYPSPVSPYYEVMCEAMEHLGYKHVDYNGASQIGYSRPQTNIRKGQRESSSNAFLESCSNRTNLNITLNAYATKIIINNHTKVAEGIEFISNGRRYTVKAKKEVILSTGAINTPQLLMLSGLGSKFELEKHNIPMIKHLPMVGQNFQDHVSMYGLSFETDLKVPIKTLDESIKEYYVNGTGSLTYAWNQQLLSFMNPQDPKSSVPTIEILMVPPNSTGELTSKVYNFNPELTKFIECLDQSKTLRIFVAVLHPKSVGTITLKSNNPADFPVIQPGFFSHPADIETMYLGIKEVQKLMKTPVFQKLNAKFVELPVCKEFKKDSYEFWECAIRATSASIYHPVGTARMGLDTQDSVVNSKLEVHGIGKLRIADASIIPKLISGHTSAPAMMIGEKVCDMIKKCY